MLFAFSSKLHRIFRGTKICFQQDALPQLIDGKTAMRSARDRHHTAATLTIAAGKLWLPKLPPLALGIGKRREPGTAPLAYLGDGAADTIRGSL